MTLSLFLIKLTASAPNASLPGSGLPELSSARIAAAAFAGSPAESGYPTRPVRIFPLVDA